MSKSRIVIFSDLHYAPEKPINNGSKIERKLMEYQMEYISLLNLMGKNLMLLKTYKVIVK